MLKIRRVTHPHRPTHVRDYMLMYGGLFLLAYLTLPLGLADDNTEVDLCSILESSCDVLSTLDRLLFFTSLSLPVILLKSGDLSTSGFS